MFCKEGVQNNLQKYVTNIFREHKNGVFVHYAQKNELAVDNN